REAHAAIAGALTEPVGVARRYLPPSFKFRRGHLALSAVAAAAAALVLGTLLGGQPGHAPASRPTADVAMSDATLAYAQPVAFASTDAAAITGWSAGRGMPVEVVPLAGQVPTGARVSTINGHQLMTIVYTGAHGATEVTVVPAAMSSTWPAMEATSINRTPVGLLRRPRDSVIVVTRDDAGLHLAMSALQT
ncbi:MAG: hypothetical protein M3010_05245, partial [Candidatus Dormibacteraeota bacterium]|nr:hypothetical protein [Candidatus Dormibacteraeota bacterium]